MKKILVLILAIIIWRVKIFLTGIVVEIDFIKKLVDSVEWLNSPHFVQLSMLIIAILLIVIIGKSKFSDFGFKGAPVKVVLKSVKKTRLSSKKLSPHTVKSSCTWMEIPGQGGGPVPTFAPFPLHPRFQPEIRLNTTSFDFR